MKVTDTRIGNVEMHNGGETLFDGEVRVVDAITWEDDSLEETAGAVALEVGHSIPSRDNHAAILTRVQARQLAAAILRVLRRKP